MGSFWLIKDGYQGKFYPINPTDKIVLGHRAYISPLDLPEPPDLALIVVPTDQVIPVLEDFAKIGTKRAIIINTGFTPHDICLNVMPLCHINSTFYTFTFLYIGGTAYIHPARSFKAEEILEIIERGKITFISLIPTHYNLILNSPPEARRRNVGSIPKADVDENTLLEYCRDKLAAFKRPKQILFIKAEEMPRTPTGKILHRVLRDRYCR